MGEQYTGTACTKNFDAMGLIGKAWALLHRPRTRFTVEPVLFLFMFATFLSYSTFQQLVHSLVCQHTPNCTLNRTQQQCQQNLSNASWDEQEVQSKTSHWILYINLASGIPAILVSLFYGSLSDHVGRRFFIILPALGSAMNAGIVLVVAYHNTLPIHFFLLGAIVSGLYGGYSVINLAVYSYGSDISNHASRTWQIGILESMTFLGATLSLIVGGVWIKAEGFVPPFWCVVACQLTIIVYTVTFLPESLRSRGDGSSLRTLPSKCFNNLVGFGKLLFGSWKMIVLLITFFVVEINFLGITDTVILYTLGHPLCWSSDLIGYFLALKVFLNGFATLFILPFLVYINVSDTLIIMVGMVAGAAALVIMGVATQSWMMFIGNSSRC